MENEKGVVSVKTRSEIDDSFKWDLTKIYENNDLWYQDYKLLEKLLDDFPKYKGSVLKNSNNLLNVISLFFKIEKKLSKLYVYAYMKSDEDMEDSYYQKLKGKVDNLYKRTAITTSFLVSELFEYNFEYILTLVKKEEKLKSYFRFLKDIYRLKKYTLDEDKEQLLMNMSSIFINPSKISNVLTNLELKFEPIFDKLNNEKVLTNSNYNKYMESYDRSIRKQSFLNLYNGYKKFSDTLALTLTGEVEINVTKAKIRKYKSTRFMNLYNNYIPENIYDNLIDVVEKNLNILYKYYKLRKEYLKLEELTLYDMQVPLVYYEREYSFVNAKKIIIKALSILGNDYIKNIKKAFTERWIDVYPNNGKKSGAYSWGTYEGPSYILLNYQNGLNDVATLVHELGHSMHSTYSKKNNNYQDFHYKTFVAEVASITNELLLYNHLLKISKNNKEKLFIINHLINLFKNTLFRQTMFAKFEKIIYEKADANHVLTNELLSKIYYDLNKLYFGSDVLVNEEIKYEWARIPHFYTPFYVYQYATGIAAATYFAKGIISGDEELLKRYRHFLTTGGSDEPLNLLKNAGVDMTDSSVIQNAIDWFSELIDEFLKLSRE